MTTTRYRMTPGDGDIRHGTINGYTNLQCRCQSCRDEWAAYIRRHYANRVERHANGDAVLVHGSRSTYGNWGCRCRRCREANAEYQSRRATS